MNLVASNASGSSLEPRQPHPRGSEVPPSRGPIRRFASTNAIFLTRALRHKCHLRRRLPAAMMQKHGAAVQRETLQLAYIDTLANSKIRLDSVKRATQIQNTSQSIAATKYFRIAAREHTLAPPGRHRSRHSWMSLKTCQSTPAIDAAFYRPIGTLYQLQPSFHTHSTEPEPTARDRRAGKEFY